MNALLRKLLRISPPRPAMPIQPTPHAIDPDELMLLFPELAEHQEAILEAGDAGLQAPEEGEKVIGHVNRDFTRRIMIYLNWYRRRVAEEQIKASFGGESERAEALSNAKRYDQAGDALREIMFLAVMQETDSWGEHIGLRKDWAVVSVPNADRGELFIRKIFGPDL